MLAVRIHYRNLIKNEKKRKSLFIVPLKNQFSWALEKQSCVFNAFLMYNNAHN